MEPRESVLSQGPQTEGFDDDLAEAAAGEEVVIELGDQRFTYNFEELTEIVDVNEGMKGAASQIAYWGNVLSLAEALAEEADASYRGWRAKSISELLSADPKLAEWKAKAEVEASVGFQLHKLAQARANRNVSSLQRLLMGLTHKSELLRSVGARQRAELEATGMTTRFRDPDADPDAGREAEYDDATSKMRDQYRRRPSRGRGRRDD
jgi:hypothetical protein